MAVKKGGNMHSKYEREIGERLRQMSIDNSYAQEQLAAKMQLEGCDMTRSTIAKIEAGLRHIYPWELKAFSKILNITYDDILG